MFSDAALAVAVDSTTKWIYNASRRLNRPLQRSLADVFWWRMTHHLAGRLGIPLLDAAKASDLLLRQGSDLSRVRLRSTADDSVVINVDLARFHNGAALAASAGLYLAIPRRRGRPPAQTSRPSASHAPSVWGASAEHDTTRLARVLASIPPQTEAIASVAAVQVVSALADAGIPSVIVGRIAAGFHGEAVNVSSLDLLMDFSARYSHALSTALNSLQAVPRGVSVGKGFHFDSGIIRSAPCLALLVKGVAVNIVRTLPGVGGYDEANGFGIPVILNGLSLRVLSQEAYVRTLSALARTASPA